MGAFEREVESTFALSGEGAAALIGVLDDLCARGLHAGGLGYRCEGVRKRVRTYLYLTPPSVLPAGVTEWTDRLIFHSRGGEIRGRLSSKCWKAVPGGLAKHHCGEVRKAPLEEWVELLRERPVAEAALVKAQRRYTFRAADGGGFHVALDAMVPFPPDAPLAPGDPFYHLEVEAEGGHDPASVATVLGPLHPELAYPREISASKKEEASRRCGGPRPVHVAGPAGLRRYLDDAGRTAAERLGGLLPAVLG